MKKTVIAAAILAAGQFAGAAQAATCADRTHVVKQLELRYGETLQGISKPRKGAVLEVYASRETETWTVLLSVGRGLTCLVSNGRGFAQLEARYRMAPKIHLQRPEKTAMLHYPMGAAGPL